MLDILRKKHKLITWIIAIAFIVGMALMGLAGSLNTILRKNYIAVINGQKIRYDSEEYQYYEDILQRQLNNYSQQNDGAAPDSTTMSQYRETAWEQLIRKVLVEQQIRHYGLKAGDSEIIDKLKNPDDQIKNMLMQQGLTTQDGKFDEARYNDLLLSDRPITEDGLTYVQFMEKNLRESIPQEKLRDKVTTDIVMTDSLKKDATDKWLENNNKVDLKIVSFDPRNPNIAEPTPSEAQIAAYYTEHRETEFKRGPSRKVKFIARAIAPSADDRNITQAKADSIYNELANGADFAALASKLSDDKATAKKGGDAGWIQRGSRGQLFDDAAFSVKMGEILHPLRYGNGFEVVMVNDRRTNEQTQQEEVQISRIFCEFKPSAATKASIHQEMVNYVNRARVVGLDAAATEMQIGQARDSDDFYQNDINIPGMFGSGRQQVQWAFANQLNVVSDVMDLPGRDNFLGVLQVIDVNQDPYQTLDKARMSITNTLKEKMRLDAAYDKAVAFAGKVPQAKWLDEATQQKWEVRDQKNLIKSGVFQKIGKDEALMDKVFAINDSSWVKVSDSEPRYVYKNDKGAFLILMCKHQVPDMTKFEGEEKEKVFDDRLKEEKNKAFESWYLDLRAKAKIKDYRMDGK